MINDTFLRRAEGEGWHTFYILGLGRSGKWKNRGLKMERKKKKRGREGRKTQIWFPPGKLGHCAAAFLRFMGIGAGILRGTLNFLTLSSLFKHFQLPNNTHISNDHVMVKARSRLCNSLSLCCCKKKKKKKLDENMRAALPEVFCSSFTKTRNLFPLLPFSFLVSSSSSRHHRPPLCQRPRGGETVWIHEVQQLWLSESML